MEKKYLSISAAAKVTGKSKRTIQRYISKLSDSDRVKLTTTRDGKTFLSADWIKIIAEGKKELRYLEINEDEFKTDNIMDILEKELEDMVFGAIGSKDFNLLDNRGLPLDSEMKYGRQVNLRDAGVADIVGFKKIETETEVKVFITVIELKRYKLSIGAFSQANRYLYYIEEMIKDFLCEPLDGFKSLIIDSNIILIGSKSDKDIKGLANTFSEKVSAYEYSFSLLDGCEFTNVDEFWVYENEVESLDNIELFSTL